MSSSQNRYVVYKTTRLPRQKRTNRIHAKRDDIGRYYRCWNCGATCDSTRESLDTGAHGRNGTLVLDAAIPGSIQEGDADPKRIMAVLDDHFTCLKNGFDGDPITTYRHENYPDVVGGCWFCGCKNYR